MFGDEHPFAGYFGVHETNMVYIDILAWSKLILNDYPVYGLAVYGLARGGGSFPYRTKNRQPQTKGAEEGSAKSKAHW